MAITHQDMGHVFYKHILCNSKMAGWIAEMIFMLFFAYIAVKRREHC